MKQSKTQHHAGMALVTVIIFAVLAMLVIIAGLTLATLTAQSKLAQNLGQQALFLAESGAEEALLRLLRNPDWDSDNAQVLTVGAGTVRIDLAKDGEQLVIWSTGETALAVRRLEVRVSYDNGIMQVDSWREVF